MRAGRWSVPVSGSGLGDERSSVASCGARQRCILVHAPVAARARADAQLDRLTTEHLAVSLQREDHLHWTTTETTHTRAEAHELEQVRHPVGSGCSHHHHYHRQSSCIFNIREYMGSPPEITKNCQICQLFRPVGADPMPDVGEIRRVYAGNRSTEVFLTFGAIRLVN